MLDLPRPIFMTMGRVAVEKNLEAFLSLDLPGSKVVIGDGPQKAMLQQKYPDVSFLGEKKGKDLSSHLAAADVFVFPSLTDTFGVVQLEALACGTPVAAFPVTGPLDVIADHPIGAINNDLRSACMRALRYVARDVPEFCAGAFLGEQRAAVHRQSDGVAAEPFAAARRRAWPAKAPCRANPTFWRSAKAEQHHGRNHQARRYKATRLRPRNGRAGLRPLGTDLRPRLRRRVQQGPASAAIPATNKIGGRVLEVGVGTGISLPQYAPASAYLRHRYFGSDAAKGAEARHRTRPEECRRPRGDGRRETRISRTIRSMS